MFVFIINVSILQAQYRIPKFGDVDTASLSMKWYEWDTNSAALILFDNGDFSFYMNESNSFQNVFVKHCRIKIFNSSAFHLANQEIKLQKAGSHRETISDIRAATYNLVNGKIIVTNVDSSNIFIDDSKYLETQKIAFPEVREGSIIEFTYKITSDFYLNLKGWVFQYPYPVIWSQFSYSIPEDLNFRRITRGNLPYDVNLYEHSSRIFTLHYESLGYDKNHRKDGDVHIDQNIELKTIESTLAIAHVPAFVPEPNTDCIENYLQTVQFELRSIHNPVTHTFLELTQSWKSIDKLLDEDKYLGKVLKSKKNFVNKDDLKKLYNKQTSDIDKARAIYKYVQNRMKWNEKYLFLAFEGLSKPYTERIGNSAEINMILTHMLRNAGIKAFPVVFSTRENGRLDTTYPSINNLNNLIVYTLIDSNIYLLDATNKFCPFGVLPGNDINGRGRVLKDKNGEWVDLDIGKKFRICKRFNLKLNPDGKFEGSVVDMYDGYGALVFRETINDLKSTDEYYKSRQEKLKGLTIKNYVVSDVTDINKSIIDTLNVVITDNSEIIGNKIIFPPLIFERLENNIYSLNERKYPIDYNYRYSVMYLFEYQIPEGYSVESIPESFILKLPDNSMSLSYNIQQSDGKITLEYKHNIEKISFQPDEYKVVKEFYNQIVKKHSEMIILTKNN